MGLTLTKTTVKSKIKKEGKWSGYIVGNKVNPVHYFDEWKLAVPVTYNSEEEFDKGVNAFLYYLPRELGTYAKFIEKEA